MYVIAVDENLTNNLDITSIECSLNYDNYIIIAKL